MSETFTPIIDEPGLRCLECGYFRANMYLFENHTAYPNCGDQTCVSAFFWDHQMALKAMEQEIQDHYDAQEFIPLPEGGIEL